MSTDIVCRKKNNLLDCNRINPTPKKNNQFFVVFFTKICSLFYLNYISFFFKFFFSLVVFSLIVYPFYFILYVLFFSESYAILRRSQIGEADESLCSSVRLLSNSFAFHLYLIKLKEKKKIQ